MIDTNNINDIIGADVHGTDDKKIGTVGQVYLDSDTQKPAWITIKTGLFGNSESFAPLREANFDGDNVNIRFDKDFVKDAPRIADDGTLSVEDEQSLYSYYGDDHAQGAAPTGDKRGNDVSNDGRRNDVSDDTRRNNSTDGQDGSMTRSEEQLRVGTEKEQTARARLSKHVVTDEVHEKVPVSHEEVSISREPITDANRGDSKKAPELGDEEHDVTLTGERVVTDKETVPVERVNIDKETVTEQQDVTANLAHEEIDVDESGNRNNSRNDNDNGDRNRNDKR